MKWSFRANYGSLREQALERVFARYDSTLEGARCSFRER